MRPVDRLTYLDQASFLGLRATGLEQLAQWVWVYERAVDLDGLGRFHDNLRHGLFGRLIERSPLPFGRHRWVAAPDTVDIDVAEMARPRAELSDWADEHAQSPIDPEWGPGWRLAVQPFTDGSTAVSLLASHCLVDGLAGGLAIADAANGRHHDFGYPPAGSRTLLRALGSDARQTLRDIPEVARAIAAMARLARGGQQDLARLGGSQPIAASTDDATVMIPAITIQLDARDWDARAAALSGTSNALLNAIAAKTGERLGRRRADDSGVSVRFVVSDRGEHDTRANALSFVTIEVDPTRVTRDLAEVRVAIKQALSTLGDAPDESLAVLPVTPWTPQWAVRRMAEALFTDFSVGCSNLRDVDPATGRPDGTDADSFCARGVTQHITRKVLERIQGQVTLASGRFSGKVFITVVAYDVDGRNSKPELRGLMADTLAEFELAGTID
ncbi:MAG: hypothetical protein JWQ86_1146 [Mycobacterium sp.]|jgi:hypothetical protein|nr:hypothetical protein [Mycobacterium sp.]